MQKFTETGHCRERVHCQTCRTEPEWREMIMRSFEWDGECPYGVTIDTLPEKPKMPSVPKQMLNLTEAVGRAIKAFAKGKKVLASKDVRAERIAICEKCDQLQGARCAKCGCATNRKIALQTESCPLEKW